MEDLRIGVIGFGARHYLATHAHHPGEGSAVTVVADPGGRGQANAREAFGEDVAIVDSVEELLAGHEVDAVMILTPDFAHAAVALQTLEAGIPTFCEKPMAISVEDTDAMLAMAKEKRARLYIGHNMRHMPVVRQMKEIVDSGRIGRVRAIWCRHFVGAGGDFYFKDWHAERAKSMSLLLQKGAHDIDVIHWLAGGYTRRVSGIGDLAVYGDVSDRRDNSDRLMRDWYDEDTWPPTAQKELNPVIDVEDISMLTMTLDNGVLASYQQCHFTPDYFRNYTVIGDAGRIENMGDGSGARIPHLGVPPFRPGPAGRRRGDRPRRWRSRRRRPQPDRRVPGLRAPRRRHRRLRRRGPGGRGHRGLWGGVDPRRRDAPRRAGRAGGPAPLLRRGAGVSRMPCSSRS